MIVATEVAPPKDPAIAAKEKVAPPTGLASHAVISDSSGHFELRDLAPGTWSVKVSAPDLQSFQEPHIALKPGEHRELQGVILPVAEQHADVTVTVSIKEVAEQELHDQEQQRALAIFPNFNTSYVWNAAPLNAKQKFKLSFRSTLDPVGFITAGIVAGAEQVHGTYPDYGDGFPGYARRYGAAWGNQFIGHTIGYAILPSIFRQDPRYFYMGPGASNKKRAVHALLSGFLCRGNNGHTQFNISHVGGNFIAGYISRAYHPDSNDSLSLAVDNTLIGIAGQAGVDLVREFVLRHISSGTPKYGTGKPPAKKTVMSN